MIQDETIKRIQGIKAERKRQRKLHRIIGIVVFTIVIFLFVITTLHAIRISTQKTQACIDKGFSGYSKINQEDFCIGTDELFRVGMDCNDKNCTARLIKTLIKTRGG